ncbi:MAG: methyltransferase domain-containing protein [Gammaproteobacteria bacterium]
MSRATTHALQPRTDHDGTSRRLAVLACKRAVRSVLESRLRTDYERRVLPELKQSPTRAADVERQTRQLDSYKTWSSATRASQDWMWRLLAEQVDADYGRIAANAKTATATGSITLDELDAIPTYQTATSIHGQPGGYMLERDSDDLAAGILYEAGGNIYALGQGIGRKDSKGQRLIRHVRDIHPDLAPKRILEMGCSAGGQSTDYPAAFPDAEFHAIDLSPAMLRFAHARAVELGAPVHFHQMDAGNTRFPDGHFDLIISHNMFHEVAAEHMPKIMRECHRLLAPGGVCIHQDVPIQTGRFDAYMQMISEWQKDNNDEPFWLDFANADLPAMMVDAGFEPSHVGADYLEAVDGPIPWYVVTAVR